MIEECVIIGGGVAGLAAANQLADAGKSPLIIDGGEYPCHRICGEYFSHEGLPLLKKWGISLPREFNHARFVKGKSKVEFQLPVAAGGCPRFDFDVQLYDRALKKGARALLKTTVLSLELPKEPSAPFELLLSDQQVIKANHLIIGTGKLPKTTGIKAVVPMMKYIGFKSHFEGIEMDDSIEVHLFPGGYLGLERVSGTVFNMTVLINKDHVADLDHPEVVFENLLQMESMSLFKERMKNAVRVFPKWLVGQVPEFGIRKNPDWERVFWIGDAAGGIPPISGEGLAIALTSGCMAADYLMHSDAEQFRIDWAKRYRKRIFWAQQIHKMMIRPFSSEIALKACHLFPSLPVYLWKLTREEDSLRIL